jgi:transposase
VEEMPQERLSMRKIEEILRLKYEAGLTHRAIAQSCLVSPSTVSEYVTHAKAAGLSWPLPEGINNEQLNELLFPQRGSASGRNILQPDWAKVHKELRRKSVTLSLLWVEYRQEQPDGYGYSQFCHQGTGEIRQAQIFVATLGASNYTYAEAHWSQDLPNWIGAHVRTLAFLGGTPEVLVPDNLKVGVKSPHLYEPDLNPTYLDFAQHYGVAVVPARVRKPKDKSKVEVGVQVVERWILAPLRDHTFFSLAELNKAMWELLAELNNRPMRHLGQSRLQLFESLDKPALAPLPVQPYEFARWKKARVHIDYHVSFEKHYYSVPYTLIRKEVDIRATEKTVEIYYQRKRRASHRRSPAQGRYSTQNEHLPPAHQKYSDWSPERFLRWAEEIGPDTTRLIAAVLVTRRHPQQAYRSCLGILGLGKRYTNARLEAACRRALPAGIRSYKGIRNILENNHDKLAVDQPPAAPLPSHATIRGESYYN